MPSFDPSDFLNRRKVTLAAGSLVVASIVSMTLLGMWGLYARQVETTTKELEVLDAVLAEESSRAFQNVDIVLEGLVDELSKAALSQADLEAANVEPSPQVILRSKTSGLPQVARFAVATSQGAVTMSSRQTAGVEDVATRDYFVALNRQTAPRTYLSAPALDEASGRWKLTMARRIPGPGGELSGIAFADIDLGYFDRLYDSLDLPEGSAISLWRRDGILLARHPVIPLTGEVTKSQWNSIVESFGSGTYHANSPMDGLDRIVATRAVKGFPLVLNVSRTHEAVLREWRGPATTVAIAGVLGVLASIAGIASMLGQFRTQGALVTAIGDRDAAEAARSRTEEHLRQSQKMEAVGQLTGGIAHDFNNMLAVSMGSLDLLKRKMDGGDADLVQHIDDAVDGLEKAAHLTRRLLAFSRRQALTPAVIRPARLVEDMAGILGRALGSTIRLETSVQPDAWPVRADASQIENAILNLAINARDAMPGGGRIFISARNEPGYHPSETELPVGDYVAVAVSDEGTGMTPEILERAIEPFFTTKGVGKGSGLGLSQVYGFARQSGGTLTIDSRPDAGTCVTLHLPRYGDPA